MVCLSYRGYWTSHDRPYEEGINKDAESALQWITERHRNSNTSDLEDPVLVLWGQSIGCGFATNLAASTSEANLRINALVLETPFTSTRDMLTALYPQKWLPYQHLWPFLRNHLDSWSNFGIIAKRPDPPAIHMIIAGKDELVPADHGVRLLKRGQDVGLSMELRKVEGALHNEAIARIQGKSAIAQSITSAITGSRSCDSRVVKPREDPGR
jgi:pimeloyl-ACP methyl ester carboxylesterase